METNWREVRCRKGHATLVAEAESQCSHNEGRDDLRSLYRSLIKLPKEISILPLPAYANLSSHTMKILIGSLTSTPSTLTLSSSSIGVISTGRELEMPIIKAPRSAYNTEQRMVVVGGYSQKVSKSYCTLKQCFLCPVTPLDWTYRILWPSSGCNKTMILCWMRREFSRARTVSVAATGLIAKRL